MTRLSGVQRNALAEMSNGAQLWEAHGLTPLIDPLGPQPLGLWRSTFRSLVRRGYVVLVGQHRHGGDLYQITEAGRTALASHVAATGDGEAVQ